MEKHFIIPTFSRFTTVLLSAIVLVELILYGTLIAVPALWVTIVCAALYLIYMAVFRQDTLPMIFVILFLTAHHSLLLNFNRNLPIALLFLLIFAVNSSIMWVLLRYGTQLQPEYHRAYSLISGFMIAQIITLFATLSRDWPIRFEVASYMPTVFSYIFWRFACLSANAMLGWKQFVRVAILVIALVILIIIGSAKVPV